MGRVALITGASRGVGKEIALRLARCGWMVALTYREQSILAQEIVEGLRSEGHSAMALVLNVEDRQSVKNALSRVEATWGNVNLLVNNAALAQEKPFELITDADWDQMLAVNLRGPFICAQECLPSMIAHGRGRIVNITSIGGQWGGFNQVHYAASKAGLINLTRSLAKLYSQHGVTTNAIAIGLVQTDMSSNELSTDAGKEKVRGIPRGRIGSVQDVASAVVFLANDDADYITGQTINVNGGMYFG